MIDAALARRIRLLGLDVDGVLTDNGIYVGPVDGQVVELKRFNIQDGLGQVLMRTAGLPVVWVSGRHSEATAVRARELRVEEVLQVPGPRKLEAFGALLERRGLRDRHGLPEADAAGVFGRGRAGVSAGSHLRPARARAGGMQHRRIEPVRSALVAAVCDGRELRRGLLVRRARELLLPG